MKIPARFTQGDSAYWDDVPAVDANGRRLDSAAYSLKYLLRGAAVLDITAAAQGTGWRTTLTAASSAGLVPGEYSWTAQVSAGAERITVGNGRITITPDLTAKGVNYDARTPAELALSQAEAALSSFKSSQGIIKKYQIGTRTMEFATIGELLQVISYWKSKVQNEKTAASIANGLGNPRNLFVRFS